MHLELGPHRFDLRARTVLIAGVASTGDRPAGADALWVDGPVTDDVSGLDLPVGAPAAGARAVELLVERGVALVGVPGGDVAACRAAVAGGAAVLVPAADVASVVDAVPPARLVVSSGAPVPGATACCAPDGRGPAAWGEVARAHAAGVRVVRTADHRSVRRVVAVLDRIAAERKGSEP